MQLGNGSGERCAVDLLHFIGIAQVQFNAR